MRPVLLVLLLSLSVAGLVACGVKSPLVKPGPAQKSDERDPSMPPQPLGR